MHKEDLFKYENFKVNKSKCAMEAIELPKKTGR